MQKIALALFVLVLAGCAVLKPAPDADYGTMPTAYEQPIKAQILGALKDPDSARIKLHQPRKAYRVTNWVEPTLYGYLVVAEVNAKNSYGGYTGYKDYLVFMDGEEILAFTTVP